MTNFKQLTLMLVAMLSMTAGAWAQTPGVKPLPVPDEWNGDDTNLYINHLPKDFVATTDERARALKCPNPAEEDIIVIYGFDEGDFMNVVEFKGGEYHDYYGIQYTLGEMFNISQSGTKWYYTTEPSIDITPVTGQTNQWTFLMPGYNVLVTPIYEPEFAATFVAGNNLTIQGGKATLAVTEKDGTTAYTGATIDENGKFTPLYEGQTVTMTAAPGYKFKSVEVKDGAKALKTLTVNGKQLNYVEGDTWQQAIERTENAGSGWRVQGNYIFNGEYTLFTNGGGSTYVYVRPGDTIDATKNYSLEAD